MATAQIRIEAQVQQALAGIEQVSRKLEVMQGSLERGSRAMEGMQRSTELASRAMTALVGAISVREIINLADAATLVNNKLTSVTNGSKEAQAAFQQVAQIAQTTGQRFEAVADLYQKIRLQSDNLGLSAAETARITENFSKALVLTGTTGQAAASAIYQFGQALGRGKVAYEDIRQLQESSSATVALIAKQFGMSGQEFVAAVQAGKISAEQLALAVNNLGEAVNPKFKEMNKTVGQSMENIRTNFILLIDRFEKSTGAFAGLAKFLEAVAKNMDAVVIAGAAFITVYAVQRIMAIAAAIRAVGIATAFASGGITALTGGIAALLAYGGFKLMEDGEAEKIAAAEAAAQQAGQTTRGINDARKKSEQEITKEQMAGLDAFLRKIDAERAAAGLKGQELAVQKMINEAAQALKITEEEMSQTIKNRVTQRAIEIYQQEQAVKNAKLITQAESERNKTLHQATMQLNDQLELSKLSVDEQEIERQIRQMNRSLVREIRNEQGELLGVTKGLSAEEEKITREKLQQIQANRRLVAQAQLNAVLTGQAVPQTVDEQISTATGAARRLNPARAQQSQYETERAAIEASVQNEQKRNELLEKLRLEHSRRMHEIFKQQTEAELRQAGVTNAGILDAVSKSQDNIRMMQEGGIKAVMGGIDQMGYIFGQLGTYNKRAFEAAKAFNIANAVMNTYLGATKALAMYPPPFNFIAAAAVVASGLAQVAAIRSQSFSGRQLGGPVMGGQTYLVGENGPELFTPNTTGSITRNQDIGGGPPVNINFTIVANDTTGFDQLLNSRRGMIQQIISDAMLEKGRRSMV